MSTARIDALSWDEINERVYTPMVKNCMRGIRSLPTIPCTYEVAFNSLGFLRGYETGPRLVSECLRILSENRDRYNRDQLMVLVNNLRKLGGFYQYATRRIQRERNQ